MVVKTENGRGEEKIERKGKRQNYSERLKRKKEILNSRSQTRKLKTYVTPTLKSLLTTGLKL